MSNYIKGKLTLFREIIFGRLGLQNDFVGYETLIKYIGKNNIQSLSGDFLEIGAFMGGGVKNLPDMVVSSEKNCMLLIYLILILTPRRMIGESL